MKDDEELEHGHEREHGQGGWRGYLERRSREFSRITTDRLALLDPLADHIRRALEVEGEARLNFICTHNSRRSHFGQVWAAACARYVGVEGLRCHSGGTVVTAFEPRAVAALGRAGLRAAALTSVGEDVPIEANPVYEFRLESGASPVLCWSKRFDDADSPDERFIAVLMCNEAADACPVVPGADQRIALPYADPKAEDGRPREAEAYDETCATVARELLYVMTRVKS